MKSGQNFGAFRFLRIGLLVDGLDHALQERLDFGQVEVRILFDRDDAAVSLPAGGGRFRLWIRFAK